MSSREGFENIGIIRLSSVGDVIMALPALEALKRRHPNARISWVVESRAKNILEGHPLIDELIEFPRTRWRNMWKERFGVLRSIPDIARFYRLLRSKKFDLTIDFQGNLKSAACTVFAGAPVKIGYAHEECREPNWLFTNRRLSVSGNAFHRVHRDLLLAGLADAPFEYTQPQIHYAEADKLVAEEFFAALPAGGPIVLMHPGTSDFMPHKRWPLPDYAELGKRLEREVGARVIVTWGPGEDAMASALRDLSDGTFTVAPKTPSMKSLGWFLRKARLVIGGDTGPVHLAVMQGIDAIVILGPGDPRHYYPLGHPERAFYRRVPCSPCRNRSCKDLVCLTEIRPAAIGDRCLEILGAS